MNASAATPGYCFPLLGEPCGNCHRCQPPEAERISCPCEPRHSRAGIHDAVKCPYGRAERKSQAGSASMTSAATAQFCDDCREGAHDECRHNGGWLSDYNEDGKCLCHRLGHVG